MQTHKETDFQVCFELFTPRAEENSKVNNEIRPLVWVSWYDSRKFFSTFKEVTWKSELIEDFLRHYRSLNNIWFVDKKGNLKFRSRPR